MLHTSVPGAFNTTLEHLGPNTMAWNLAMKYHVDEELFYSAFLLYKNMRKLGVPHDTFTLPIVNRALSSMRIDASLGKMIHCVAIQVGLDVDLYFCNTMIEAYVKCECVGYACNLFDEMLQRDVVSWTSMIAGYISEGQLSVAFDLFNKMRIELEPNSVTLVVIMQACCASEILNEGVQIHGYAFKSGLLMDWSVKNLVLRMYASRVSTEEVELLFSEVDRTDVASWNVLISFFTSQRDMTRVLRLFNEMHSLEVRPWNIETLTIVISALAKSACLSKGEGMHCLIIKTGVYDDILLTSLLDFYAKCGRLETSVQLFREIRCKSNITWGAMMLAFIQNGSFVDAISLFQQMQAKDHDIAPEIWRNLIDAYANLGALKSGKVVHGNLIKDLLNGPVKGNVHLETSILNMYLRGGNMSSAKACFDRMPIKDVVAWTTMIEGLGSHGFGLEALTYFNLMMQERVQPNHVTFLSLLSACSHSGLVTEGCNIYYSMKWGFGIEPNLDHHTCMVDLLGRNGMLNEALAIILKMIVLPDSRIWGALLSASRVYGNRRFGEYAAERLLELEPHNAGYYTLLSNIKASVGSWNEVEEMRRMMSEKDLKKKPGWSCIEVNGVIQGFVSGDISHTESEEVYETLGRLSRAIQEFG
ncbi:pentatricopeptide repeat-containing protein At1g11290, chloroplastic-like [Arachis duranensis]|uniref:Pentatricopeptide repeat-containing protein At1g11290, chloroplastic-like n=3 Tax=Arachis TaxID=3817 RepID=A0A6P4CDY3_ARADU|nr:pentatricopeptide repeat-containing protein At1g11290, chloroplastic-like [Arachis duranensis]XP_052112982.1 pentatricopeptide repeat-containing protein At1g11290, chloroplastic-like [Arachis duranensis]QHO53526.1 Pentatricopeptide repeat-containing protein [Arachis hypogaea]